MDALPAAGARAGAGGAPPPRSARQRPGVRPVPPSSGAHDHLSLAELRTYRAVLQAEEGNVSYWRRILQARLDVVREGRTLGGTRHLDAATLRPVLTDSRLGSGRTALIQILPVDDIPPLPNLGELWERQVGADDEQGLTELEQDLAEAEGQLSHYRTALHKRLGDATDELIARYRIDPQACLTSLPLRPGDTRRR